MVVFLEVPIIPTNAPPVPGLVLSIPFLTKGMQGGIMVLVGRRVFPEKILTNCLLAMTVGIKQMQG